MVWSLFGIIIIIIIIISLFSWVLPLAIGWPFTFKKLLCNQHQKLNDDHTKCVCIKGWKGEDCNTPHTPEPRPRPRPTAEVQSDNLNVSKCQHY